jgi:hypothetical protein
MRSQCKPVPLRYPLTASHGKRDSQGDRIQSTILLVSSARFDDTSGALGTFPYGISIRFQSEVEKRFSSCGTLHDVRTSTVGSPQEPTITHALQDLRLLVQTHMLLAIEVGMEATGTTYATSIELARSQRAFPLHVPNALDHTRKQSEVVSQSLLSFNDREIQSSKC